MTPSTSIQRAEAFAERFGLALPILMAPMAGACPAPLAAAVARAGGLGACGALLMQPDAIKAWAKDVRASSNGAFQMNLWIPDPAPVRDAANEGLLRQFLQHWGPDIPDNAADRPGPDFEAQCAAMLDAGPSIISSIMGVYPPEFIAEMKARNIAWFATVTTVAEAKTAVAAGADVIVAQGAEAGGHRGAFDAGEAEAKAIGLFALLPAVVDAVDAPVVATGGIADARGIAAALTLGASAVQIGTGLLRTPEASLAPAWADAIGAAAPEDTMVTRAFSGRAGRSIATAYAQAAARSDAPNPAPYPVQRALTQSMRDAGTKASDIDKIQAWAGQASGLAQAKSAEILVPELWRDAKALLIG